MSDITEQILYPGDSFEWEESNSDYDSATYTIKYYLQKTDETPKEIASEDSSGVHLFTKSAELTEQFESGVYKYQKKAIHKTTLAVKTIASGTVEILKTLASGNDSRSFNQIILDALKATLQGRATREQHSMQISGRAIQYLTPMELRTEIEIYESKVESENRIANGESGIPAVRIEFGAIS